MVVSSAWVDAFFPPFLSLSLVLRLIASSGPRSASIGGACSMQVACYLVGAIWGRWHASSRLSSSSLSGGLPFCCFLPTRQPAIAHGMEHSHVERYDVGSFDPYLRAACLLLVVVSLHSALSFARFACCTVLPTLQEIHHDLPSIAGSSIWNSQPRRSGHSVSDLRCVLVWRPLCSSCQVPLLFCCFFRC